MILDDIKNKGLLVWGAISEQGLEQIKEGQDLVIVPENRPALTGLMYNTPLLKKHDVPVIYCTDNMLGLLFFKKKVRKTLIFYKKLVTDGIVGVPGTLYAAMLSHLHGVPIKAMPQAEMTLDPADEDASFFGGKKFVLEQYQRDVFRPEDEQVERGILNEL